MSIKDRLTKKTEGLFVPSKSSAGTGSSGPLKTGPGQMLMVNALMKETNEKVAELEGRLKEFEGSAPVRLIDADKIAPSKWANRTEDGFESGDFKRLKDEIRDAEGNVQPIKVRPLQGVNDRYEIVFGHRRHRACMDLGLPVLAMVEDLNEQELFKEMDRENRARLDLSPWEQGMMYRRALDEGLFGSMGELAAGLGVDKGNISKAVRLAELPADIVAAFPSPRDLQYRWSKLLNDAMQNDPEKVLERAQQIATSTEGKPGAKQVLEILIGTHHPVSMIDTVVINGKSVAEVIVDGDRVGVRFNKGVLNSEKTQKLRNLILELLRD